MGSSVVDVGPRLAVVLVALTALAAGAGRLSGLGQDRPIVVAAVRATVQLAAVSAVLLVVVRSLLLSTAFVLLMLTVATVTSAGRITGLGLRAPRRAARLLPTALPIVAGAAPVVALVLASGTVPLRGAAVIPIAGILIGGAMTATSLAGRRLRDELIHRRGEVEAALALGLLPRDAVLLITRRPGRRPWCRRWTRPAPSGWSPCRAPSSASCWAAAARRRPAPRSCWCSSACSPPRCWLSGASPS